MSSLTTSPTKSALDPKVLLMSYLKQLQAKPLRTKMATQGSLSALTEIIASYFAYQRPGYGPMITSRVPQMAFYGACIAAPLQHFLMTMAQKQFPGKILLQQLVTMFICFPIQNTVYLSSMAIIAGARTKEQVQGAVKAGLIPMTKAMCAMHPILITFAKVVVPMEYWPVFFSLIGFSLSTFFNTLAKMRRAAAENADKKDKET